MPLRTERGLGPDDVVLDGDPAPPCEKGHSSHFSAHCGQTAGRMPLGKKVGLGPVHIVLHGDPAPPPPKKRNGTASSQFSAYVYCGQRSPISATAEHLLNGYSIPNLCTTILIHVVQSSLNFSYAYLWPPCVADADIIFLCCFFRSSFFLLSFFLA